jgi:hypothetical protein
MTFDDCLEFLANHQEELSTEMPALGIIDIMIATTYNQLRMKGMTREMIMQLMLWGLCEFSFQVQGFGHREEHEE